MVRETCDWFCLPEYRAFGVGLHLMRRMMAKPEPILVIGGTTYTRDLLPRLKWTRLPDVGNYLLVFRPAPWPHLLLTSGGEPAFRSRARSQYSAPLGGFRSIPHPPQIARCACASGEATELGAIAPYAVAPTLGRGFSTGLRMHRLCWDNSSS